MKRVLVRSVYDAFAYVMEHYYPHGLQDRAERLDRYAVISIQDTHTGGFGIRFTESVTCQDVLTLYFDDIDREIEGLQLFSEEQAEQIIRFIRKNKSAETLLIHCYAGESRSRAVGAFAMEMLGGSSERLFSTGNPNRYVYDTLKRVYQRETAKLLDAIL